MIAEIESGVGVKVESRCAAMEHEWFVFSTALTEGWLMLGCDRCDSTGSVRDPTREEWKAAFNAPDLLYPWTDNSRVYPDPDPA